MWPIIYSSFLSTPHLIGLRPSTSFRCSSSAAAIRCASASSSRGRHLARWSSACSVSVRSGSRRCRFGAKCRRLCRLLVLCFMVCGGFHADMLFRAAYGYDVNSEAFKEWQAQTQQQYAAYYAAQGYPVGATANVASGTPSAPGAAASSEASPPPPPPPSNDAPPPPPPA
jgi:hypothetical protein